MNKNSLTIYVILIAVTWLTACGPSEEEIAGTSLAETEVSYAATQTVKSSFTPEPTATFTPSPTPTSTFTPAPSATPTRTPTLTSTHTPTFTPTPELAMVYGNLHVRVIPYGAGAEVPESLGDLTLIFKSISEEIEFPVQITEPHGGYYLILSGGHYQIKTLEISALDVGAITSIPSMGWATIEIPDNGCVYIGRLSLNYYRLPPLSFTEQVAMVKEIAQGKDAILTYTRISRDRST
jgi:hypothetical protein